MLLHLASSLATVVSEAGSEAVRLKFEFGDLFLNSISGRL